MKGKGKLFKGSLYTKMTIKLNQRMKQKTMVYLMKTISLETL